MSTETDWNVKKNIKRKSCTLYDNCGPLKVSNKNFIAMYACVYLLREAIYGISFSRQRQTALSSHWTRVHSIMIWIVIFHWFSSTRKKCVACSTCYISVFVACCDGTDNGNVNVWILWHVLATLMAKCVLKLNDCNTYTCGLLSLLPRYKTVTRLLSLALDHFKIPIISSFQKMVDTLLYYSRWSFHHLSATPTPMDVQTLLF